MVLELMTPSGLLLRRDAIASGYDDKHLLRLVKRGDLIRIRQGAYASSVVWKVSDEPARHALISEAVLLQYDDHVALSHDSACLAHGGPNWGLDLRAVHLTHFQGGGRATAGLVHHNGSCHVTDVTKLPRVTGSRARREPSWTWPRDTEST